MDIRLQYFGRSDRSFTYKVFVTIDNLKESELCLCDAVFNHHEQKRSKILKESKTYELRAYLPDRQESVLGFFGLSRFVTIPNRPLLKEPDDGAYYFYTHGDRERHCINRTINKIIKNEILREQKITLTFDYGEQNQQS